MTMEETMEKARERLRGLGIAQPDETRLRNHLCAEAHSMLAECGRKTLPDCLADAAAERAAGVYLLEQKALGMPDGFTLEEPLGSIREGDVRLDYAVGKGNLTPEQRLDALLARMLAAGRRELLRQRKLPR